MSNNQNTTLSNNSAIESLDPSNLQGTRLNDYQIYKRIGEGGMAWVYQAFHLTLKCPMALKILRKERLQFPDKVERFLREVRIQFKLNHPNIVRVFEFIEKENILGFAQEWCNSGDLLEWMENGNVPISLKNLEKIVIPIIDAIGYAHQRGVIHRDLKPPNILLHEQDGELIPKVTDFGLARDERFERITEAGAVMGTVHFMPPEQLLETKDVDQRADIYSLGVLLYMMMTARFPFTGGPVKVARAILHEETPEPIEAPLPMQPIIMKCLAKNPDDRYPTCEALKKDLLDAIEACRSEGKTLPEKTASYQQKPMQIAQDVVSPVLSEPLVDSSKTEKNEYPHLILNDESDEGEATFPTPTRKASSVEQTQKDNEEDINIDDIDADSTLPTPTKRKDSFYYAKREPILDDIDDEEHHEDTDVKATLPEVSDDEIDAPNIINLNKSSSQHQNSLPNSHSIAVLSTSLPPEELSLPETPSASSFPSLEQLDLDEITSSETTIKMDQSEIDQKKKKREEELIIQQENTQRDYVFIVIIAVIAWLLGFLMGKFL